MSHHDNRLRPKGATETYNGFEVWDHCVHPCDVNHGETDGDVDLGCEEGDEGHDHEE